jgi:putative NIF3 family GTP cyclohydrolase 1 type 2
VYPIEVAPGDCGMGRIGRLPKPTTVGALIGRIKKATGLKKVLLAAGGRSAAGDGMGKLVTVAACCAGSCGSTYKAAAAGGATFYLTGEMRHHDALAAVADGVTVVCLGHSHSERIALKSVAERLRVSLPKLKVALARSDADPFEIV